MIYHLRQTIFVSVLTFLSTATMATDLSQSLKRISFTRFILICLVIFVVVMLVLYQLEAPILFGSEIISQLQTVDFMQRSNYLHVTPTTDVSLPPTPTVATQSSSSDSMPIPIPGKSFIDQTVSKKSDNIPSPNSPSPSPISPSLSPKSSHTSGPLYSSFVCLGGDTNPKINNYRKTYKGALLQHTCYFKNICYSNQRDQWLYFSSSNPSSSVFQEIIQTEQDVIHYDFNTTERGFLMMHSMKNIAIEPQVIHRPFPDTSDIHLLFENPVVFHYLQWVYNFGHVLTDNFYSMWRALSYFHLYQNNTCCQPLFKYSWTAAGFEKGPLFLPRKFIDGLNEYIFNGAKPIFLGFDSRRVHGRAPDVEEYYDRLFAYNDTVNDLACFRYYVGDLLAD